MVFDSLARKVLACRNHMVPVQCCGCGPSGSLKNGPVPVQLSKDSHRRSGFISAGRTDYESTYVFDRLKNF